MKAAEFIKRQSIIDNRADRGRSNAWRKRALAHLMREARAVPFIDGGRAKGLRLGSGQHVCDRVRYATWREAQAVLDQIARTDGTHKKPNWFHSCRHCNGWHLAHRNDKPDLK